ncbi:hypothetical protein J2R99_003119 [Rhodopseudomonas julia]|uniref:Uncharacterized protein n=1 Tax=Rhodopseudomonas julia TaxID=200617 RepID=A0ABU0C9P4_9BRAD|nr:hypothetical protein [Rhodopseudomonas julia]MDQ0327250.1 hypothetical protein [Rhodopseudomonas julia]
MHRVLQTLNEQERRDLAENIAVEASHWRRRADEANLPFLAYLIEMVVLEAWREATEENLNDINPQN